MSWASVVKRSIATVKWPIATPKPIATVKGPIATPKSTVTLQIINGKREFVSVAIKIYPTSESYQQPFFKSSGTSNDVESNFKAVWLPCKYIPDQESTEIIPKGLVKEQSTEKFNGFFNNDALFLYVSCIGMEEYYKALLEEKSITKEDLESFQKGWNSESFQILITQKSFCGSYATLRVSACIGGGLWDSDWLGVKKILKRFLVYVDVSEIDVSEIDVSKVVDVSLDCLKCKEDPLPDYIPRL